MRESGIFVSKGLMTGLVLLGALFLGGLLVAYADGGREEMRQIAAPVALPAEFAGSLGAPLAGTGA